MTWSDRLLKAIPGVLFLVLFMAWVLRLPSIPLIVGVAMAVSFGLVMLRMELKLGQILAGAWLGFAILASIFALYTLVRAKDTHAVFPIAPILFFWFPRKQRRTELKEESDFAYGTKLVLLSGLVSVFAGAAFAVFDRAKKRTGFGAFTIGVGITFVLLLSRLEGPPIFADAHEGSRKLAHLFFESDIRVFALAIGLFYLGLFLGCLIPLSLELLERQGFTGFVGARHVRSVKSGYLTWMAVLSIIAVAISCFALGGVISVMEGLGADIKRKILANDSHIVVDIPDAQGFTQWQPVLESVKETKGVKAATPMLTTEVLASVGSNMSGVILHGIDPSNIADVIDMPENIRIGKFAWLTDPETVTTLPWAEKKGVPEDPSIEFDDAPMASPGLDPNGPEAQLVPQDNRPRYPCIIVGKELAKSLHLHISSVVSLVSSRGELTPAGMIPRERKFRVAGIFYSQMFQFDSSYVYVTIDEARRFLDEPDRINSIRVRVNDAEMAPFVRAEITKNLSRQDLRVRDWNEMNRGLLSALKLERIAMFIVLSLATIVASFCILCTLLLMVTEKSREIAILKALGASDGAIVSVFVVEGMIIGGIGTMIGVVSGYATFFGISWLKVPVPFSEDVFYLDKIPVNVNPWNFALITICALVICLLSTLYPAYTASKLLPVDGLRHE